MFHFHTFPSQKSSTSIAATVKICLLFLLLGLDVFMVSAQAPSAIPYQAIARNSNGDLITNQSITLRMSIRNTSASGTIIYQETQSTTTNGYGLFTVNIGQGSMNTIYSLFSQIDWSTGSKYLQVEMDAAGGTSYVDMGTTQLLSVPYALYAKSSGSSSWTVNGIDQYSDLGGFVGIGTSSPQARLHVNGNSNDMLKLESSSNTGTWLKLYNTSSGGNTFSLISTGSSNGEGAGKLLFNSPGGMSMIMDGNGNVGIGTTSPSYKFHVHKSSGSSSQFAIYGEGKEADLNGDQTNVGVTGMGRGFKLPLSTLTQGYGIGVMGIGDYSASTKAIGVYASLNSSVTSFSSAPPTTALFADAGSHGFAGIFTNGNVGIGTTSPTKTLEVNGSTKTSTLQITNGATNGYVLQSDASGNASWANPASLTGVSWSTSGNDQFSSLSGNVGIGTSSPSQKLEVSGTTKTTNLQITSGASNGYVLTSNNNGNANWTNPTTLMAIAGNGLSYDVSTLNSVWSQSGPNIYNNTNGNVGIGTTTPSTALEVDAVVSDALLLYSPTTTETNFFLKNPSSGSAKISWTGPSHSAGAQKLIFYTPGNDAVMALDELNGRVGIGTVSPETQLEVSGTTRTAGLTVTAGAGDGYLLKSDANGNATWVNSIHPAYVNTADFTMTNGAQYNYVMRSDASGNATWVDPSSVSHWSANGTGIYNINDRVGIGTSNPSTQLEVASSDITPLTVSSTNTTATELKLLNSSIGSSTLRWTGMDNSDGQQKLLFVTPGSDVLMTLDEQFGKVGIGTTFPTEKLEVNGTIKSGEIKAHIIQASEGAHQGYVMQSDDDGRGTWVNPEAVSHWSVNGTFIYNNNESNVGIGTTDPGSPLEVSTNNENTMTLSAQSGDLTTLFFKNSNGGNARISYTGQNHSWGGDKLVIRNGIGDPEIAIDGNTRYVGIGTVNPTSQLDVAGIAKVNNLQVTESAGIGTSLPLARLHIYGSTNDLLKLESSSTTGTWLKLANTSSNGEEYDIISSGPTNGEGAGKLLINTPFSQLVINQNGYLGIGTSSPAQKLDVNGNIKTRGFQMTNDATNGYILSSDASGNASWISPSSFAGSSTTWVQASNDQYSALSGNIGIGTATPSAKLEVSGNTKTSALQMTNGASNNYVMQSDANGNASWVNPTSLANGNWTTTGSNQYSALSGNVGIGTTTPSQKLEVNGTTKTTALNSSTLQMTNGATNGYVMQSDASGNATWVNPTSLANGNWTTTGSNQYSAVSGNVGIGTSSPGTKLHVYNAAGTAIAKVESGNANAYTYLTAAASGSEASIATFTGTSQRWSFGKSNASESGSNAGSDFFINRYDDAGTFLSQPFVIKRATGNVGIGTGSPDTKVHISGGTDASFTSGTGYLVMGSVTSTNMVLDDNEIMARNNGVKSGLFLQNDGGDFNVHFAQSGGSQFIVKDDGSTGIGTASPSAMLHSVAYGAKTSSYSGNLLTNTATSATSSITKAGVEIQSTGSWTGTSASNIGLYVSSVTGGTNNYDAVFNGGGNVGIGTATPAYHLQVSGTGSSNEEVNVGSSAHDAAVSVSSISGHESNIKFYTNSSGDKLRWTMGKSSIAESGSNAGGDFYINSWDDAGNFLKQPFSIQRSTGNIGIGTNAPTAALHTIASGARTAAYSGNLFTNTATSTTNSINKAGVEIQSTGSWTGTSANNIGLYVSSVTGGTNNYDAVFNGGGNVGIGTSAPTQKLDVNGAVKIGANGTAITNVIKATVNKDVSNVPANSTVSEAFSVTNAATGSTVYISPATALTDGLIIAFARVSAAGTVQVKFTNTTAAAINPAAMDYYITVIQ